MTVARKVSRVAALIGAVTCILWVVSCSPVRAETGMASYYWHGQKTANGERFNPEAMTCAHKKLPFGTVVRVTNQRNGKSVECRISDRGPFIRGRIIDMSRAGARALGMIPAGVVQVRVDVVGKCGPRVGNAALVHVGC